MFTTLSTILMLCLAFITFFFCQYIPAQIERNLKAENTDVLLLLAKEVAINRFVRYVGSYHLILALAVLSVSAGIVPVSTGFGWFVVTAEAVIALIAAVTAARVRKKAL